MLETQEGRACLEDESEATLTRFANWAYAGYYFAGEISKRPNMEARKEVVEETEGGLLISAPCFAIFVAHLGSCVYQRKSYIVLEKG